VTRLRRRRKSGFELGALVKQIEPGGHVMTVIEIFPDGAGVIASFKTPDGVTHEETWPTASLKRVEI